MSLAFWTVWNRLVNPVVTAFSRKKSVSSRVHNPSNRPLSQIEYSAIAIKDSNGQRHVGMIYRGGEIRELSFLHLAWHNKLTDENPDSSFFWIEIGVPRRRARQLASKCRQVSKANGRFIPYGFSPPTAEQFDEESAKFIFGPTWTGLTCASFVLAVFEFARLRLIRLESWEPRDDDVQWQRTIVLTMKAHHARSLSENRYRTPREIEDVEKHIAAVESEVGCARYVSPRRTASFSPGGPRCTMRA
jgi:hypothetical protein